MRYRPFQKNNVIDTSEYIYNKSSISIIKNARTKKDTTWYGDKYIINFNNYDIEWYESYDIFLKFVKGFYFTQPDCCDLSNNAPLTLDNALTSELNYEDLFYYIKDEFYESHCLKYDKLIKVSLCKEKENTLYAYGIYYNKNQELYNFPINVNLKECGSCKPENPPWDDHCRDDPDVPDTHCDVKSINHKHTFPSQFNYIYYYHNHKTQPHNQDNKYLFTNKVHTLPFSIFPRHNKEYESKLITPSGRIIYKTSRNIGSFNFL